MKKAISNFVGIIFLLAIPLFSVGLTHFSRSIITPNDLFFELEIGEIPDVSINE